MQDGDGELVGGLDLSESGELLGIELLRARKLLLPSQLTEPENTPKD